MDALPLSFHLFLAFITFILDLVIELRLVELLVGCLHVVVPGLSLCTALFFSLVECVLIGTFMLLDILDGDGFVQFTD